MNEPTPIISRILWCRRQQQDLVTQDERAGWRAEEAGLVDALGSRDRIAFMRKEHRSYFHRYECGFEDGQALLRLSPSTPCGMAPMDGNSPAQVTTPSRAHSRPIEGNSSMYGEARR